MDAFNFPAAPHTTFPSVHIYIDALIGFVAVVCALYCLRDWRRSGSPLGLVLLLGGAIAYLNEPVDDILGLVHHPRIGQNIVLDTMGPIPVWGLPTYIIFFGFVPFAILRELQSRGFTVRAYWISILVTFVLDIALELPVLYAHGGLYQYYAQDGHPPMEVFRLPLYWLFINTPGPILCGAVLYALRDHFRGWRAPLLLLLPLVTDSACSIVVGLPIYSALHAPHANSAWRWGAAAVTCLFGLLVMDTLSRWLLHTYKRRTTRAEPSVLTLEPSVSEGELTARA
jgi:hypothetical protein